MHFEILRFSDLAPALVHSWDRLAAGRGLHADLYSSHAWLVAWVRAMGAEVAAALRIPAVLGPDQPVALLPLVARSPRRWEWAGKGGSRMRYRPVLAAEQPSAETLGLLVEGIARAGVDDLALHRLPARDPATDGLVATLRQAGFHTSRRRTSSDCLAVVEGGWDEHRRRLAGYERQVKRQVKRLVPLWEVTVDEYGPATGNPVLDGFEAYAAIYDSSWKRPMPPRMHTLERELVRRTASLGWPRVYVLRLDGQPAAAEVWFRLGRVVTSLGTAYDQRMAALGPGSIIAWWAQERLFAEAVPGLIDHLPGYGPQKDQLGPDRSPIVEVEAARRTVVSGITFPVRRQVHYVVPRVAGRVRRRIRRLWRRAAAARRRRTGPARAVEVAPGPRPLPAEPLSLDQSMRRFLAVAGGHPNPTAMARGWRQADTWWRVGAEPVALVRLGSTGDRRVVREVVLLRDDCAPLTEVLAGLGATLGAPLAADLPSEHNHGGSRTNRPPIAVQRAVLDWPRQRPDSPAGVSGAPSRPARAGDSPSGPPPGRS
jgi:CelD/BcsL family acetyltransferase involved in cellulose biosynthesis